MISKFQKLMRNLRKDTVLIPKITDPSHYYLYFRKSSKKQCLTGICSTYTSISHLTKSILLFEGKMHHIRRHQLRYLINILDVDNESTVILLDFG